MRLLLIEDELALQLSLKQQLEAEGYQVDVSGDGKEGLFYALEYPVDAAIIDIGLPSMSGIEVIKKIRSDANTLPIIILTARSQWQQKVEGLEAGADDYLVKPFQYEELSARLKALLRRATASTSHELRCGPVSLNTNTQQLSVNEVVISITSYEYLLLEYLARHSSEAVSKSRLADYLYPHDDDRDSNVIEVLIGRIRKKLQRVGIKNCIETLRNRGYRFTLCDKNS
ncbi:MAG: response regulator transcription factor [Gammaproteobacteria bacterium]|nr:response regulator transcription factor [Gammaproteobacteria bacterium]